MPCRTWRQLLTAHIAHPSASDTKINPLLDDKVLDSGLDETSCYFEDGDGLEVTHGFFFDRVGVLPVTSSQTTYVQGIALFTGGDFFIDTTRRKV